MNTNRPWLRLELPSSVNEIRSMLSHEEKQYLTWLSSEKYEGWGAIVELGVWLGSSSAALAEGLRMRGLKNKIHSFDLFRWEDYMAAVASEDLKQGDDFMPLYLREIGEYRPWIDAQKVDLLNYSWTGGPIEILFVDSAKTWDLANAVLKGFGAHLVPGRSRIVLEDFRYPYAHCLPLIFDSRPDVWKEVEDVLNGPTVTFVPLKPLFGPSGIEPNYSEDSFPLPLAENLLRSRMEREEGFNRQYLLRALYRKILIDGPLEAAGKFREAVLAGQIEDSELRVVEDVESTLHERGWAAMSRGDYEKARETAERCLSIPGRRSIYSLTLLGFSLFRLGDCEGAERVMNEVLCLKPGFPSARLFRVELAIQKGRCGDAETEALQVLKEAVGDEPTISWTLDLLTRAWDSQPTGQSRREKLGALEASLGNSPALLAHMARERA